MPRAPCGRDREDHRLPEDYPQFLDELEAQVRRARLRATRAANTELLILYWTLGPSLLERQRVHGWGSKVVDQLARDLRSEFPHMRGLSRRNLFYMRSFADAWPRK
ncbi:DUF1016 N-terminal domain-containing protein [Rhodococcus pyridinivorans]|uniref:DUF1016 N-terminal domain-containing protein n=1 Tax=Rhodococcus pyridinivorans TaxID=103816 RepID=UPI0037C8AB5A